MNKTVLSNTLDVCGFYELDTRGTVVYSRIKQDGKFEKSDGSRVGQDFFEEIFACQNSDALRRRFFNFITGKATTETFIFGCQIAEKIIPLRVLFVRVSEGSRERRDTLFYVDIKQD